MLVVAYATGRASHARQVKGDDPDKKGYPGHPGWGLGVRLTTSPRKKYRYETSRGCQGPPRAVEPLVMMTTSDTALACIDCQGFPTTHFIHLLLFYSILQYSFMFNPIQWIIPKKYLTQFLRLLFRFRNNRYQYFVTILHHCFCDLTPARWNLM